MPRQRPVKPWLHDASGYWCTSVNRKRIYLDKDYQAALRKLRQLRADEKRQQPPKSIEEFIGRVNSGSAAVSIARMKSPSGWLEPGQTPEFDEYTVVLRGCLHVRLKDTAFDVGAGQAIEQPYRLPSLAAIQKVVF